MALSYSLFNGDGSTKDFVIGFSYIETAHVKVTVDKQAVGYTVDGVNKVVRLDTAPASGSVVRLYRETPLFKTYSDFKRGNAFGQSNVNNSFLWQLMLSQELSEGRKAPDNVADQDLNMGGFKVINMEKGVADGDAVNVKQLEERIQEINYQAVIPISQPRQVIVEGQLEYDAPHVRASLPESFFVQINGITQRPVTDYTTDTIGKILFTSQPAVGSNLDIRYFEPNTIGEDIITADSLRNIVELSFKYNGNVPPIASLLSDSGIKIGHVVKCENGTTLKRISDSNNSILDFKPLGNVNPLDFGEDVLALNQASDFAIDNGVALTFSGGEFIASNQWKLKGSLHVFVESDTKITFSNALPLNNLGWVESTEGELTVSGAKLTLDANSNSGNGAIMSSLKKFLRADNHIEALNLPNGTAYFASHEVNQNSSSMRGRGYFKQLIAKNVRNGVMVYGTSDWWDETAPYECSFELGNDCIIENSSITEGGSAFSYLFNKLLYGRVGGLLCKDYHGYYKSFSTNLENGDWTTQANTTLSKNRFTTTSTGGIYTIIPELTVGEKYFCVLGGSTTNVAIEIRNGTTGSSPIISNKLDEVAEFTASSSGIYIRVSGAGVTQVSDFAVFKKSDVSSNVFQCSSADIEGARYIGTRRGPVVGIDCKNFTIRATKTFGASITGLDIDLESLPNEPQLYPDAYGKVYGNVCKYIGVRGLYSTARNLSVVDNDFYYAADTKGTSSKGCMRFNTKNETDSNSGVCLSNNRSIGTGDAAFVSVYRGKVKVGSGNVHDSDSAIPFFCDKGGDSAGVNAAFEFTGGGQGLTVIENNQAIPSGNDIFVLGAATTAFKLPAKSYSACNAWRCQIARGSNTNNITITTSSGSINGSGNFVWPSSKNIITVICVSNENDFYVE